MNSASKALVWRFWRKNRSGFILLLILLGFCGGLRVCLEQASSRLRAKQGHFARESQGTVSVKEFLTSRDGTKVGSATIQVGLSGYSGIVNPQDELVWSGVLLGGTVPVLRASIGTNEICQTEPLPPFLTIRMNNGTRRTVQFERAQDLAAEISGLSARLDDWRAAAWVWSILCTGFSVLVLYAVFAAAESNGVRGFTGMPPAWFTLPLTTAQLAFWPVGLGTLSVLATSFAWTWGILSGVNPESRAIPHVYIATVLVVGLVLFQILIWALPAFPKLRAIAISGLVLAILGLAVLPFSAGPVPVLNQIMDGRMPVGTDQTLELSEWSRWIAALGFVSWSVAVGLAWVVVEKVRHGSWAAWRYPSILDRLRSSVASRRREFASPSAAQRWIEWRRNGRRPLLVWTLGVWAILGIDLAARIGWTQLRPYANELVELWPLWALGWIVVTGLNLARDATSGTLALSSFTATRPLATGSLYATKIVVGFQLWGAAVIIGTASWGAAFVLENALVRETTFLFSEWQWRDFLVIGVVVWMAGVHLLVGILPLCLSGRLPGFPWSLLPYLLFYAAIINGWHLRSGSHAEFALVALTLIFAGKLAVAYWGFRISLAQKAISKRVVMETVVAWIACTFFLAALAWSSAEKEGWTTASMLFVPGALLLVPLARLAISPMALLVNRHR